MRNFINYKVTYYCKGSQGRKHELVEKLWFLQKCLTSKSTHLCLGVLSSLSFWLSHQYPLYIPILSHLCYMPCPPHPPWLDHSIFGEEYNLLKLLIMQFSPISQHLSLVQIFSFSTLFSDTLSLCSSLNVKEQVSHPYRTSGKIKFCIF
jgi:hypothetical protein